MKRKVRVLIAIFGGLLGLCLVAGVMSALGNRSLLAEYSLAGAAAQEIAALRGLTAAGDEAAGVKGEGRASPHRPIAPPRLRRAMSPFNMETARIGAGERGL